MKRTLKEIATIRFGYHAQPQDKGNIAYLQAGQFDSRGKLAQMPGSFINLDNRSSEHVLVDGDMIFVGKGNRNFAWCYRESIGLAVASSIFFIIQPDKNIIHPEYLTAYFNMEKSQQHFRKLGEGSNVASIRKSELGEFIVPVLPMKKQREIAAISELHLKKTDITENILKRENELYNAVMNNLVNL